MPNLRAERIPGTELYRAARVIVGIAGIHPSLFNFYRTEREQRGRAAKCPCCGHALPEDFAKLPEVANAARGVVPDKADEQRACFSCGDPLPVGAPMPHLKRLFCSNACRQKAYRPRQQQQVTERGRQALEYRTGS